MLQRLLLAMILVAGLCWSTVRADEPTVVFDNRPEFGFRWKPRSKCVRCFQTSLLLPREATWKSLVGNKIKTVRIRYYDKKTWTSKEQVSKYVAGFLTRKLPAGRYPVWSEGLAMPQIECFVEFTDEYRNKLFAERQPCHEGRLLIWEPSRASVTQTGKWWFIGLFDYFHKFHPKGSRELARPLPKK